MNATAPGKVLWAGEYAVLDGATGVVVAVNRRVTARLGPAPAALSPFLAAARAVLAATYGAESPVALRAGRVLVDSASLEQQGKKLGLGSSAAATVAAVAVALGRPDRAEIHALAHRAHAAAQAPRGARGSGADVAAATWGGVLAVSRPAAAGDDTPLAVVPLPWPPGLSFVLVWSSQPADTPALVARVRAFRDRDPAGHRAAIDELGMCGAALADAFRAGDAAAVVALVARGAEALAGLGARAGAPLVPAALAPVADLAAEHGGAAKPTGAGGGDLILAAFPAPAAAQAFRQAAAATGLLLVPCDVDPVGVSLA